MRAYIVWLWETCFCVVIAPNGEKAVEYAKKYWKDTYKQDLPLKTKCEYCMYVECVQGTVMDVHM